MNIHKNLKIKGSRQNPILLDIYYTPSNEPKPLVLFCHGFKGFKDWGHFDVVAKTLANEGFVVSKFNFSYNGGTEEQPIDFPDLEAFGHNNISTELDDLGCMIDAWQKDDAFIADTEVDRKDLAIIGHSRGGGACILKAAEDSRVKKLVTWAAVGSIGRLFKDPDFLEQWKNDGVIYIPNGRTKQQMPMYYQYFEDYLENIERLDIPDAASRINIPWLIVHGTKDPTVSIDDAIELHFLNPPSELFQVEGAGHTFGGKHPWESDELPADGIVVANKTVAFLRQ
ncbi:MAG: alpha/beta hydrolase [Bacteroidetes bacterium]|nr:alpha/beta hydrolase [Bacteroidota bacterium]